MHLDGFRLGEQVYASANSLVYQAVREEDQRPVFAKILPEDLPPPGKLTRLRREFRMTQDFETEADYVGLYTMALTQIELESAPIFWREMALVYPDAIGLSTTHPTTVERFLRMDKAVAEIQLKQEQGAPLRPERKNDDE